jgi:hypothetical protein
MRLLRLNGDAENPLPMPFNEGVVVCCPNAGMLNGIENAAAVEANSVMHTTTASNPSNTLILTLLIYFKPLIYK